MPRKTTVYQKQERTVHRTFHLSGSIGGKPKEGRTKHRILQAQATDHRTPVRDPEKAMGLYPYPDEGKTERSIRGKPDHDLL
nr:hypothetical protein [Flagellimonas sp. 389]